MGDFEEDRKPNIEYLDSLNEHNKRSRSVEDEGGGDAERKQARVGLVADSWGQGQRQENGDLLPMNGVENPGVGAGDVSAEEDPIVYGLSFCFSLQATFSNDILHKPSF